MVAEFDPSGDCEDPWESLVEEPPIEFEPLLLPPLLLPAPTTDGESKKLQVNVQILGSHLALEQKMHE